MLKLRRLDDLHLEAIRLDAIHLDAIHPDVIGYEVNIGRLRIPWHKQYGQGSTSERRTIGNGYMDNLTILRYFDLTRSDDSRSEGCGRKCFTRTD